MPSDEKHRRILMLIKDYCHYDVTGRDVGLLASCFIVFPNKESGVISFASFCCCFFHVLVFCTLPFAVTAEIKRCRRIRMCGFSQNSQSITNDAGEVIGRSASTRALPELNTARRCACETGVSTRPRGRSSTPHQGRVSGHLQWG